MRAMFGVYVLAGGLVVAAGAAVAQSDTKAQGPSKSLAGDKALKAQPAAEGTKSIVVEKDPVTTPTQTTGDVEKADRLVPKKVTIKAAETSIGKFTTADEIRPILGATQANWVGVREFGGKDLLYFTHLESWRCGLNEITYGINGGEMQVWETDPCYIDEPAPNAIKMENGHVPYATFPLKSVETVVIGVTYDDGDRELLQFERRGILMP